MALVNVSDVRDEHRFCCNDKCICYHVTGVPDDEMGPISVVVDDGTLMYSRALVVVGEDKNNCYFLCEACKKACDIVHGKADPNDRPVNPEVLSSIYTPRGRLI